MTATATTLIPAPYAGVSLNSTRSSAEWYELNNDLFTVRGKRPHPDKGDPGSGLQAEIAELQSMAKDERSTGQRTRLRRLDYELELGLWVGGNNELGTPVPIAGAAERIAGYGLLNDWSARDLQAWEYQPLGPFLAKNFHTTISPWIVTAEALEPFRAAQPPRPAGDPAPLPHLHDDADQKSGAYDIALEAFILTAAMRDKGQAPHRVSHSNTTDLYWTLAQLVAHHTSGGCNLMPGDLFGTGTISGQTVNTYAMTTVKHKARKVSLGSVKFSLKAGKSKTVVLKLRKASKKLLAAKRSLKVRITITLTSAGHRRTVVHRTTTLHRKG